MGVRNDRAGWTLCGALALTLVACAGMEARPQSHPSQKAERRATTSVPDWPEPAQVEHDVVSVGFAPHRLTVADGAVWVASLNGAVYSVDPGDAAGRVVADVGSSLAAAAVADGRLFVGDNRLSRVLVFNPSSGKRQRVLSMPGPVRGLLSALGSVWITAGDSVVRLDPSTLQRRGVTAVGGEAAQLAMAGQSVVVTNRSVPEVTRLDAVGRVVGVADVGGPTIGVAVTDHQVWVLHSERPSVTVLSRERFAPVGSVELPGVAYDATAVGQEVWVTLVDQGTVARVAPDGTIHGQVAVGRRPLGIVTTPGSVWVANEGESTLWRLSADLATVGT